MARRLHGASSRCTSPFRACFCPPIYLNRAEYEPAHREGGIAPRRSQLGGKRPPRRESDLPVHSPRGASAMDGPSRGAPAGAQPRRCPASPAPSLAGARAGAPTPPRPVPRLAGAHGAGFAGASRRSRPIVRIKPVDARMTDPVVYGPPDDCFVRLMVPKQ